MKYCPKCGKQLADGEVCTCQTQQGAAPSGNPAQGNNPQPSNGPAPNNNAQPMGGPVPNNTQQPFQGQMPNGSPAAGNGPQPFQGQMPNGGPAPYNGQQAFNGQAHYNGPQSFNGQAPYNGQPQMRTPVQTDPMVKELAQLFKGIVKSPAKAIAEYVKNASVMAPCILIAVLAFISGIKELLHMVVANMQSKYYTYYKVGDVISGTIGEVVTVILSAALIAVLIMVIINAIEKDNKVTFAQALAIASLGNLLYIPLAFIGTIFAMIPVKFFSYLSSWIKSFGAAVGFIYTFFGIRAVEKDDNHMPLVYGCAALGAAILTTVISLIF